MMQHVGSSICGLRVCLGSIDYQATGGGDGGWDGPDIFYITSCVQAVPASMAAVMRQYALQLQWPWPCGSVQRSHAGQSHWSVTLVIQVCCGATVATAAQASPGRYSLRSAMMPCLAACAAPWLPVQRSELSPVPKCIMQHAWSQEMLTHQADVETAAGKELR
jgi:hypothetical protein